jgi:hypothetical protein
VKRLLLSLLIAGAAYAAPKVGFYRYASSGPERMFAGYSYVWFVAPAWAFDATCDTALNNCYSADYTPASNDVFVADPSQTPPGGVQNQVLNWQKPLYKAVNVGTNGNAAGYWNIFQAVGSSPQQQTITSTATTRFYLTSGYQAYPYLHQPVGWPAGTSFSYYYPTSVQSNCLNVAPTVDPSGYLYFGAYSSGYTRCVEITIPASASPGTYTAGWDFCADALGNGCAQLLYTIVIEAPPALTFATPAPVPLPPIYDTPTPCLTDIASGTTRAGSDCSFKHIASGGAEQHGSSYWCQDRINPDNTLESAGYYIAFSNTGGAAQTTGLGFYYDAARVYYSFANWFNDPTWENCARAVAARYAQVGPGATGFPGELLGLSASSLGTGNGNPSILGSYWNTSHGYWASLHSGAQINNSFPKGIEMGMSRFNGGRYSSTQVPNAWNSEMKNELWNILHYNGVGGLGSYGGGVSTADPRTPAYNFDGYVSYRVTGEPLYTMVGKTPTLTNFGLHYAKQAESVASMLLMFTQPGGETGNNWGANGAQVWMLTGPVLESALNYWEQTREPRMAQAIKYVLDLIMSQYSWTAHAFPYVNAQKGFFCCGDCNTNSASKWYAPGAMTCDTPLYAEMDGMAAYAFAWYWRYFGGNPGGDAYRQMADELFTYSLIGDAGALAYRYKPKPYYQNAKYWPMYLHYRLLAN